MNKTNKDFANEIINLERKMENTSNNDEITEIHNRLLEITNHLTLTDMLEIDEYVQKTFKNI